MMTPDELHAFIRTELGLNLSRIAAIPGHDAPFDYVQHAFFERPDTSPDCLVWAARGSGKTMLGALVTVLDMMAKPGIQIRILGGSRDQSARMYRHVRELLRRPALDALLKGRIGETGAEFSNGSRVEILSQSERSVRGQRVHKLRCDEVELFDPDIWQAAQLVTKSEQLGDFMVRGAVEGLSTMHRPWGLMQRLVEESSRAVRRVFKWSVIDVLERCEPARECAACPLHTDCKGRAKSLDGHVKIDDAVRQFGRTSLPVWTAEMLCERPSRENAVYPEFDESTHVIASTGPGPFESGRWVGGMDFGFRSPTVLLWAVLDEEDVLHVVDELAVSSWTIERIIDEAAKRPWPKPEFIGVDVAGRQRNDQTGASAITLWRRAGWRIRSRGQAIHAGIEGVRARLLSADGRVRLRIHPRCTTLVAALKQYHYPDDDPTSDTPVKDGPDHAADALRYLVSSLDQSGARVDVRRCYGF
jgi:hypothetical protein